jgi:hypothetical protein
MNKRTRDKLYPIIVKRDGECCNFCGKKPPEYELVIDHKDNDNSNNELYNLQLLCRACNYKKNPRRPLDQCVSVSKKTAEDSISINRQKEPQFRKFVYAEIGRKGKVLWDVLAASGAEIVGISIETARKYLVKMTSEYGQLQIVQVVGLGETVEYRKDPIEPPKF